MFRGKRWQNSDDDERLVVRPLDFPKNMDPDKDYKYISIPIVDIPAMAEAYVTAIETQRTNEWCRCEWIIHPEDGDKPKGKRRMKRGAEAPDCPVHTKAGFLIYFFQFMIEYGAK